MRWPPWKKRSECDKAALDEARERLNRQRETIEAQQKVVDETVQTHREVLRENHLAQAVRNALRNAR